MHHDQLSATGDALQHPPLERVERPPARVKRAHLGHPDQKRAPLVLRAQALLQHLQNQACGTAGLFRARALEARRNSARHDPDLVTEMTKRPALIHAPSLGQQRPRVDSHGALERCH